MLAWLHRIFALSILSSTPLLIHYVAEWNRLHEYFYSFVSSDLTLYKYDYIIVGGGSAGSVLASRLTENPQINILLIEAGGHPHFLTGIPAFTPYLQLSPYDWSFETEKQDEACKGMIGNRCKWPRGKMLGGTAGMNYMLYVRGNKRDFDEWEEMGFEGWGYEKVLPYFKKSELQLGRYAHDTKHHGTEGNVPVSDSIYITPMAKVYKELAQLAGLPIRDYNAENQTGFDIPQLTMRNGWRGDPYRSYIEPIMNKRPNLKILTYSHVTKLLFDDNKKIVTGVELLRFGKTYNVSASKEIILSAGAIGSPTILMHSGVGHAQHLKDLNIPLVKDLPVGDNLQDHITTMLGPLLVNQSASFDVIETMSFSTMWDYFVHGKGPLSTTVAVDFNGFLVDENVQLHFIGVPLYADYGLHSRKTFNIDSTLWDDYFSKLYGLSSISVLPALLRPKSRGTIRLSSSDPLVSPIINPNYLSHPQDIQDLIKIIDWVLNVLFDQKKASHHGLKLPQNGSKIPQCAKENNYWECFVRHFSLTMYHPAGTCPMGSVLDSQLRVHGLPNLRVIDASSMPLIVRGNPNAAIIMMAEKISDHIKESFELELLSKSSLGKEEL
ncbi:glucose dehydrogenase [FAD, quinone] isoform X2 [Lepeophtheirus salmonis]|uniref:glucose dehydrogenase [FAD, quinone] isoform X2 n=1 Tax=Lepeophtheirus salmonis TaxID=72036 RepID=UPI001AE18E97|nr:glucose dehydrogenase [FAD, quinone]-like isoform X2 [Lepeophtheirus salmonis]